MVPSTAQLASPERRIPWGFLGALAAVTALGWTWSLQLASAGHHGLPLRARVLMWTTMMVGMMVPPEVPGLVRVAQDASARRWQALAAASGMLGGYLAVWALASAALAVLDAQLGAWGLMTHEMASRSILLDVGILAAAGLVQLSPWKTACLARCRALPARPRGADAVTGGLRHGVASVSSCGVLMLVLFVVGAMNWVAMAILTGFLAAERLAPASATPLLGRLTGLGLLLWAGALTLSTVLT